MQANFLGLQCITEPLALLVVLLLGSALLYRLVFLPFTTLARKNVVDF